VAETVVSTMGKLPLTLYMERGPLEGQSFVCTNLKRVTIGRTRASGYQIKDPTVSQKHAIIEWKGHRWTLVDVGSSNGTALNEISLQEGEPVELKNGDMLRFGEDIKMRVMIEEEEEAIPGVSLDEWFEQEKTRIARELNAMAEEQILEMKEETEHLKQAFIAYALSPNSSSLYTSC